MLAKIQGFLRDFEFRERWKSMFGIDRGKTWFFLVDALRLIMKNSEGTYSHSKVTAVAV